MTEKFFNALCEACDTIDKKIFEMIRTDIFVSIPSSIQLKKRIDEILDNTLMPFIDPGLIESEIDMQPEGLMIVAIYGGERIITQKTYYKLGDIIKVKLIEVLR